MVTRVTVEVYNHSVLKDKEVLERIEKGDESALDYLYSKYYNMMVRMVVKNSGTEEEARDVYQDALVVFWEKAASGNLVMTSKISTFIYSICKNLWRKELNRKKRLSREEKDGVEMPDHDKQERINIVNQCINNMEDSCRQILQLYYFERLSMAEIAERIGLANADTAKTKKYKCKKELERIIKNQYSESDFMD